MAHQYQHTFAEWAPNGSKNMPSTALKSEGFVAGMKPPAGVFNYQWDKIGRAITELQEVVLTSGDVTNLDNLSTVATTGSYNDLTNKPTFHTVATSGIYSDLSGRPSLATVATTGSYNDLTNKPSFMSYSYGSYTGTGSGSGRVTLTFPFTPRMVIIGCDSSNDSGEHYTTDGYEGNTPDTIILINGQSKFFRMPFGSNNSYWFNMNAYMDVTWDTNSVSFVSDNSDLGLNGVDLIYYYSAIG